MNRTPLGLTVQVTTTGGARYRWDANQPAANRPLGLSFRTKIGEGFSDGDVRLPRRADLDYPDLGLADTVTLIGADGFVAYEGRVAAIPRSLGDTHSIGVTLAGWMAHAKDRKFTDVFVDRDVSQWGAASAPRRGHMLATYGQLADGQSRTDPTDSQAGISTSFTGAWAAGFKPISEAWYDAGSGNTIGAVSYAWARQGTGIVAADANWYWTVVLQADSTNGAFITAGDLAGAGPGNGTLSADDTIYRHAVLQLSYESASAAGADGTTYEVLWSKVAVYGNTGVGLYPGDPGEPYGVRVSEVIKNIAGRYCPQLDTSGVQETTLPIPHLVFRERTYPYDAFLELNKYHLWHLAVWEGRRLTFQPYDLTDYVWEVRTDDPGTTFDWQGQSTESLFNGIAVTYTDVLTGRRETLTPDDTVDLADGNPDNPWTKAGLRAWDEIELRSPTTATIALSLGRAALADRNRPKTPGTITVRGYIRDRSGHKQPVWKVRAGDTVIISNFPNDSVRLIVETDYDDDNKQVRLAIDKPFALLEAVMDRQAVALQARGLG